MSILRIDDKEYRLHPVYDLYGADVYGNIIDIITKTFINNNQKARNIIVRKVNGTKPKQYKTDVFIWETHNGIKSKRMTVNHINNNEQDNRIDNLRLDKIPRKVRTYGDKKPKPKRKDGDKKTISDEQKQRNDMCKKRWRERENGNV